MVGKFSSGQAIEHLEVTRQKGWRGWTAERRCRVAAKHGRSENGSAEATGDKCNGLGSRGYTKRQWCKDVADGGRVHASLNLHGTNIWVDGRHAISPRPTEKYRGFRAQFGAPFKNYGDRGLYGNSARADFSVKIIIMTVIIVIELIWRLC